MSQNTLVKRKKSLNLGQYSFVLIFAALFLIYFFVNFKGGHSQLKWTGVTNILRHSAIVGLLSYGMAMISTNDLFKEARATGHDGLALGAYTAMYWIREKNFGVVVMTNGCTGKTDKVFANILCESAELLKNHLCD